MKAGATYNLIVKLPEITDEPSEQEIIDEIIFTIKCGSVMLSKVYPSDVSLVDDIYIIPLNQAETKQLVGNCQLEAQINYANKAVQKSYIQSFTVSDTLATKDVEGVPDSVHNSELILKLIGSDVLVISIVPEVADEIIKNMNKIYLDTKQAMEDTKSYGEQTKSELQAKLQDAISSIDATTAGKLQDIANTTIAQLESINKTAVAQIESINIVAKQNIKSGTEAVTTAAQRQIGEIETVADAQIKGITETAQGKIADINKTATSQIEAINKTAQAQAQAIEKQGNEILDKIEKAGGANAIVPNAALIWNTNKSGTWNTHLTDSAKYPVKKITLRKSYNNTTFTPSLDNPPQLGFDKKVTLYVLNKTSTNINDAVYSISFDKYDLNGLNFDNFNYYNTLTFNREREEISYYHIVTLIKFSKLKAEKWEATKDEAKGWLKVQYNAANEGFSSFSSKMNICNIAEQGEDEVGKYKIAEDHYTIILWLDLTRFTSLQDWLYYIENNDVQILTRMFNGISSVFTSGELFEKFLKLQTYNLKTSFILDNKEIGVNEVTYAADIKTYIDNKITSIQTTEK